VRRPDGVPLVEVMRSGRVESVHRGSLVVLGEDGAVRLALGIPDQACFPRSSNKPLQAVGMLRAGLEVDGADLAVVAASHSGEPAHLDRIRRMLRAAGVPESALACPASYPLAEQEASALIARGSRPAPIYMNCSGKHTGMLLTCRAAGWPLGGYTDPWHPLQKALARTVADLVGEAQAAIGVDGCGAPLFGHSLTALARGYARLVTARSGSRQRRVADAMREHPELVGGSGREDTVFMRHVPGLLLKGGAEGVHAGALPSGAAFAFKIDDGATRARPPVIAAVLRTLGVRTDEPADLAELATPAVTGGGQPVGELRVTDAVA
jgi:L-asparaginase II